MASRVIKATNSFSQVQLGGNKSVYYNDEVSAGSAISSAYYVTGGTISITNFGIDTTSSFYLEVYIDGSLACRSVSITDTNESYHTVSASINTSSGLNGSLLLGGSVHEVAVKAIGSDSYVGIVNGTSAVTVTVNYALDCSPCGAPTSVTLENETAGPGAKVKLSWSGATAGKNNPIRQYQIHRANGSDGTYSLVHTVSSTATFSSYPVSAPTANGATYYFKVVTVGAESGYNSERSEAYAALTCDFSVVTMPQSVTLEKTNAKPGEPVLLSWSGAAAGTNNAIKGYEIHRAHGVNAEYEYLETVTTSATSGSTTVFAPMENFASYSYKVKTLGTAAGTDSALTDTYATLTCSFSATSAPTTVLLNGAASLYALPDTELTLEWYGATDGANNPVTGYEILCNGETLVTDLSSATSSYTVKSCPTAGEFYIYAVIALGESGGSTPSAACTVYSYTNPTPPNDIIVSDEDPSVGARVTLSWGGAEAGGYNDIIGYRVYRSEEVNGGYTLVANVESTDTSASCFVDAPPLAGLSYYYRVETVGSYSGSGLSEAYLSLTSSDVETPDSDVTVVITPKPPRAKRKMVFGDYDTDIDGQWTLCEWSFSEPEAQTNYVEVPGRAAGPIDMSTALTGGDPRYNSRELEARFECSEGTRLDRNEMISVMVNRLNGQRVDIVLPDDPTRYVTGRLHVKKDYNDMAHASVSVSAVCDPWRYSKHETRVEVLAVNTSREVVLSNAGRRIVTPEVTVFGLNARVYLTSGSTEQELTAGTHRVSGLALRAGNTPIQVRGEGTVTFRYREAIL